MKVSKKLLVKDKTSMDAKIVVPSKVITTNNGKKVPAKVDTGKSAMDSKSFPEKKLVTSSRSRKKASTKAEMPKIKRNPPLFFPINESGTTEAQRLKRRPLFKLIRLRNLVIQTYTES